MIEVRQTIEFSDWLHHLKDVNAVARIIARLLCGGDKRTQRQDIKRAQVLAERQ
jgi:putative component of toxin-antitoxin plasmid stabilization module